MSDWLSDLIETNVTTDTAPCNHTFLCQSLYSSQCFHCNLLGKWWLYTMSRHETHTQSLWRLSVLYVISHGRGLQIISSVVVSHATEATLLLKSVFFVESPRLCCFKELISGYILQPDIYLRCLFVCLIGIVHFLGVTSAQSFGQLHHSRETQVWFLTQALSLCGFFKKHNPGRDSTLLLHQTEWESPFFSHLLTEHSLFSLRR